MCGVGEIRGVCRRGDGPSEATVVGDSNRVEHRGHARKFRGNRIQPRFRTTVTSARSDVDRQAPSLDSVSTNIITRTHRCSRRSGTDPVRECAPVLEAPIRLVTGAARHTAVGFYARDYEEIFGPLPDGITAYERRIQFEASRFDQYVAAVTTAQSDSNVLTGDEIAALRLFIGKASCTQCYNGPLLTATANCIRCGSNPSSCDSSKRSCGR